MGLLTDTIREHIEEKHRQEDARKASLRDMNWRVALDPSVPQDHREEAQANLSKLLHPEAKKSLLDKAVPLFDHLRSIGQNKGQLPTPQSGAVPQQDAQPAAQTFEQGSPVSRLDQQLPTPQTQAPVPAASAAASKTLPTPATKSFGIPSIGTDEERAALADASTTRGPDRDRKRRTQLADENGLKGRDRVEFIEKGNLPAQAAVGSRRAETWKLADGKTVDVDFDPKSGSRFVAGEVWDIPEGASREQKAVNLQTAWFKYPDDKEGDAPHAVRVDPRDPSKRVDASTGKSAPDGATQVDPAVLTAKIRQASYGQFGNLYRALMGQGYSDAEASKMAGDQVEQDFQKRQSMLGAGSIHEAIGQDAQGNSITVPLVTTRTPNQITPLPPPAASSARPVAPGGATPQPADTVAPVPQAPSSPQSRMLPGVSPATAKNAAQFGVPITESVVQIFGDENQPGLKGYAKLADNEASSKRIGTAIQLTMNGFGEGIGEASLGGGAGSLHVSSGGFGTWLQNALGVPGKVASQQASMIRDAMKAMTPEEREAYDATMAEMSVMAGLRSLSKSPAAMASIRNIEREIPKIGINVANSTQMYDQLQKVASAINNAVTTPGIFPRVKDPKTGEQVPVGISSEMLNRIKTMPDEMQRLKGGGRNSLPKPGDLPKPAKKGARISVDDAKAYIKAAGGDSTKARLNATLDGWTF